MTTSILVTVVIGVLVLGPNTLFWSGVGTARWLNERRHRPHGRHREHKFGIEDVAVLIPAHNEEAVLSDTLQAAARLVPRSNIHVVSDGSTDRTADIARAADAEVLALSPNRGKAGALLAGIWHFQLSRRFGVVLILDADTRLDPHYLTTGLPEFDDEDVVAVAGRARCLLSPPPRTRMGRFLVAYRARVYAVSQLLVKYGQAARCANVVPIVPGMASIYRADILEQIDVAAPDLVIEDFNMTFDVHAKKLGRIAFQPGVAEAYTQDPDTVRDYLSQIRRWSLGFWQTVRLHRLPVGRFSVALKAQITELVVGGIMQVLGLLFILWALYDYTLAHWFGHIAALGREFVNPLGLWFALVCVVLPDVLLTVFAAIALKRPSLLLFAPLFPVMRFVDAVVCLRTIPMAWSSGSTGRWVSPERRQSPTASGPHIGKFAEPAVVGQQNSMIGDTWSAT
jgi:poly-beta-1,6-N-acetyl-D-glucosamine synthase